MPFWTYILHCRDSVFYTGHTDDLDARIAAHESGTLNGWTNGHLPGELVWSQDFPERYEALAAERQIKRWSRKKRLALIHRDRDAVNFHARSKSDPSTGSGRTGGRGGTIHLTNATFESLLSQATQSAREECCGLLLGRNQTMQSIQPAKNIHATPRTHFEIDPATLIAAYKAEREGGPAILGFYHSHPNGLAEPSSTDRAMAAKDGKIWAIIAVGELTFWRDVQDGFEPLSYLLSGE